MVINTSWFSAVGHPLPALTQLLFLYHPHQSSVIMLGHPNSGSFYMKMEILISFSTIVLNLQRSQPPGLQRWPSTLLADSSLLVRSGLMSQHDNVKILDKVIETFFLSWLFALIHVYPRVTQYYEQKILLAGRMDKGPGTGWSAIGPEWLSVVNWDGVRSNPTCQCTM